MSKHYKNRRRNDPFAGLGSLLNNMNINQLLAVVLAFRGENIASIAPLLAGNMEGMDISKLAGAFSGNNNLDLNNDTIKNMMNSLNLQDIDMEKLSSMMGNLNSSNIQDDYEKKHKNEDVVDVKFQEVKGLKPKIKTLTKEVEKGKYNIDDEMKESSYNLIKMLLEKVDDDKLYNDVSKLCE